MCAREFTAGQDADAGLNAAMACYYLRRGDRVLEWGERLEGTPAEADVLGLVGYVQWSGGDLPGAVASYERQYALRRRAGEPRGAAESAYQLFQLHWRASRFNDALEAARRGFESASEADDGESLARAAQALYTVFFEVGDLRAARRVLELRRDVLEAGDDLGRARLKMEEGSLSFFAGRLRLAREIFLDALELATPRAGEDNARALLRSLHLNLVEVGVELGRLEDALSHLEAAESFREPDGSKKTALLAYRGRVELAQDDIPAAVAALDEALGEASPSWASELEYWKGTAEERRGRPAEAEAAYLRAIGHLEAMRNELGLDELKDWLLDQRRRPYEALVELRVELGRPLAALETFERAKARTFIDAFIRQEHGDHGHDDREDAVQRAATLEALLPALGRSEVVEPRDVAEILERVGSRYVLAYLEAGDDVRLAAVTAGEVRWHSLGRSPARIAADVERFLADPGEAEVAEELGRVLLPPELPAFKGRPLHVVADGALGRLPFAALRRADHFLVEDAVITFLPSLNALAALLERPRPVDGGLVVLGDPRGDLPAASRELVAVAGRLGTRARTGSEAHLAALRSASGAALLHLATHSGLGDRGPWLLLADTELDATAVIAEGLGPRQVVLASCASAARHGRGLWGSLGGAFLVAGSESVLASLWSIDDTDTHDFVLDFYDAGGSGAAADALARVQRSWVAAGREVSDWAPFVHFGLSELRAP